MTDRGRQEIEVKFAVAHHAVLRQRILASGARQLQDRHLERNWRFDTPDHALTNAHRVLRVRQADHATITYKSPGATALIRTEIECRVDDSQAATELLEALGYQIFQIYEKYREVFKLGAVEIMLDELPFGSFVELEAASIDELQTTSELLGLQWAERVSDSYLHIFDKIRAETGIQASQATFEAFRQQPRVTPFDLGFSDALLPDDG